MATVGVHYAFVNQSVEGWQGRKRQKLAPDLVYAKIYNEAVLSLAALHPLWVREFIVLFREWE